VKLNKFSKILLLLLHLLSSSFSASEKTMAGKITICSFVFVFSLLLSLPSQISAHESEAKEFVLTLDHSNFSDTVKKHNLIVVQFYAPWYVPILLFFALQFYLFLSVFETKKCYAFKKLKTFSQFAFHSQKRTKNNTLLNIIQINF